MIPNNPHDPHDPNGRNGPGPPGSDCPGTVEHSFPGTKDSVAQARAWLRAMLEKYGIGGEPADNAVLVLSELATNAAIHSRSSGTHGTYLVRLRRGITRLRLEVTDAGGRSEPRARRHGNPSPGAHCVGEDCATEDCVPEEGGHGLALVGAFTTRWWTRGDEKGRTVGAELALTQPT